MNAKLDELLKILQDEEVQEYLNSKGYNIVCKEKSGNDKLFELLDEGESSKGKNAEKKYHKLSDFKKDSLDEEYSFYAIAAKTGYAILKSAKNCKNQLDYYRDAEWRGFEYADDALDWIKETVPTKAHIRCHDFCSLEYMLKHENYWFSRGRVE